MRFNRPDLVAVRQRLAKIDARVSAATQLISDGAPIRKIQASYKVVKEEIKIAHKEAKRDDSDLTPAELAYWRKAIGDAAVKMITPTNSVDTDKIATSLYEAHAAFWMAISKIDNQLKGDS